LAIDLLVLVLYLHGDIEAYDFQAKVSADNKVVGLDIPVSNTVFVKKRDTPDEAPT